MVLSDISTIARKLDINQELLKQHGKYVAKVDLKAIHPPDKHSGKLVLITSMTATPAGEGKTVTSIGLSMALNKLGRTAVACLRQPSLGPVFGVKGGAAGGGKAIVEPMQEINLGFTGDIDAVGSAHNLLSAMLDNHIYHGNALGIDARTISWKRVMDMNERTLRHIVIGLGGKGNGTPREDGFVITAASEVMAILCMSKSYADLKNRLGEVIVGYTRNGPVRALDLNAQGAMSALLRNAFQPNLVQTAEGTPALVHGGPFGNIAMGTCSIVSIYLALNKAEFTVVESGFATDLGAEKFFDVVSRIGAFQVDCVVIVASVRSLMHHGQHFIKDTQATVKIVEKGLENLAKHIENIRTLGVEPVIAINKFDTDTEDEIRAVEDYCKNEDVLYAVSTAFADGGAGSIELARLAIEASSRPHTNKAIYSFQEPVRAKIEKIVTQIYGGKAIEYEQQAVADMMHIESLGLSGLPLCMSKTQFSLSDDPSKLGRPRGFTSIVRRVEIAAGAGFLIVDLGDIVAMPGLPLHPAAENIDLSQDGTITGVY